MGVVVKTKTFRALHKQGVVTTIGRVLLFVTAIKMKSNDQVDFQARIKRSKSLAAVVSPYAVGGAWIRVGGANEAGRASRQGSRNQAPLNYSSKSSDQSRFCGSKHFDRGHKC